MRIDNISSHSTPPGSNGLTTDHKNLLIQYQQQYYDAACIGDTDEENKLVNSIEFQLGNYQDSGEIPGGRTIEIIVNHVKSDSPQEFIDFISSY